MKIIYTSALIENKFEQRKSEYISSYTKLKSITDKDNIFVLECYLDNLNFLNDFDCRKFISLTHDSKIRNKGVLEFKAIKSFVGNNSELFSDDDFVIKITGRYELKTSKFLDIVQSSKDFDFIGKLMNYNTQIFAGMFAIKFKFLKLFLDSLDFSFLEKNMVCIENSILDFLLSNNVNCGFIKELEITAPIFGVGDIMVLDL